MSEETKRLFRNANIGIAVGIALLIVGFFPTLHSDVASTALKLAAFAISLGVFLMLSVRDERARRNKGTRRAP